MNSRHVRLAALGISLVVAAVALVAHSLVFNFVTDDAFISFVYAKNLARHGQLVFNLGEHPVEGYTNFLWTLLLAGLLKLGLVPEVTSRVLGTAFAVGTLGTCAWLSRRVRGDGPAKSAKRAGEEAPGRGEGSDWSPWDALPGLLLAGVPGYACWASGGLETQLFAFLVTLGAAFYLEDRLDERAPRPRSGLVFGLAALTRPEGVLLFGVTIIHYSLVKIRAKKISPTADELRWIAIFSALVIPHLVWRRWYYGYWLPNTFYIKSSGIGGVWNQGGYYLLRVCEQFHLWAVPLVVIPGLLLSRERGARQLVGYTTLVTAVFALYVASVGGDFMGLYRFVLPVIPLTIVCAAMGMRQVLGPLTARQPLATAAVVALALAGHGAHAVSVDKRNLVNDADHGPAGNIDYPGFLRAYAADRAAVGKWFARYARPDDYAAVGGAGAQVYYSDIRSLDCFGLSDEYIAHKLPARSSRPGHQKYATDEYILSKHPTIITSGNYHFGNAPYIGADANSWMARGYHYVTVPIEGASTSMYSFLLRNDRSFGPLPRLTDAEREP
jgi:hypothetical protein